MKTARNRNQGIGGREPSFQKSLSQEEPRRKMGVLVSKTQSSDIKFK
jgi:hypothetical protein